MAGINNADISKVQITMLGSFEDSTGRQSYWR